MDIKIRQRLAPFYRLRETGKARQQRRERWIDLQRHPRAAFGEQRDVAAELDSIAQRLATKRPGAEPQRLVEGAGPQPQRRRLPAPFRLAPAGSEIAGAQPVDRV